MLCERCRIREANIQYTEVINGVKKDHHFCAQCAKEMDFGPYSAIFDGDFPLGKLLSGLLGIESTSQAPDKRRQIVCPTCNTSYDDFVKNSRFGCGDCYSVFGPLMEDSLKQLQGSVNHTGKKPKYHEIVYMPGAGIVKAGTNKSGMAKAGTVEPGAAEAGAAGAGLTDAGTTKPGAAETRAAGAGLTEAGITEPGAADAGTTKPGMTDAGTTKPGAAETRAAGAGVTEAGITKSGTVEARTAESGTTEAGITNSGTTNPGTTEAAVSGGRAANTGTAAGGMKAGAGAADGNSSEASRAQNSMTDAEREEELLIWAARLKEALRFEDYEEAAVCRDQIRELKKGHEANA